MFGLRLKVGLLCLMLLCLSVVYAHDEHEQEHSPHGHEHMDHASAPATGGDEKPNYFTFPEHRGLLYGHILMICVGWIFVMPVAAVLNVSGSRYHFPTKLLFLAIHGVGAFLGFLYDNATPDLYPNNSYRKLGWAVIWILAMQSVLGVLGTIVRSALPERLGSKEERSGFIPVTDDVEEQAHRPSGDSGQGEEYYSRSPSTSSLYGDRGNVENLDLSRMNLPHEKTSFDRRLIGTSHLEGFLSRRMPFVFNTRVVEINDIGYSLVERFLVILGFVQICLGVVAGSGIFMGDRVFNGLAHFIKGGIFFLYGVFTLGRWLGAFSELGWAWNLRPPREFGGKWRESMPSAEMVESILLFVYGCSNVFLEHLAGAGGAWSHGDLEHVSIAFMFIGGGLCGILVESRKIRALLNRPISTYVTPPQNSYAAISPELRIPNNYNFSYNPLPAVVIFILGSMMSKHHQASALSTTIHTQWGTLLSGSSVFRLLTYALLYLSPPSSYFPSRPPTEIVGSFCLMAGGLVFMSSNKDTVGYLERTGADPMFILTVIIGLTALLMSWITGVMAVKGWALRREQS